jgi:hypothetical protein
MFKKYNFIENKYISNFIKKVQQQLTDNVYDVDCFICFILVCESILPSPKSVIRSREYDSSPSGGLLHPLFVIKRFIARISSRFKRSISSLVGKRSLGSPTPLSFV